MGCFDEKCAISDIPIRYGDPVVLVYVMARDRDLRGGGLSLNNPWEVISPPTYGKYNDYGEIEDHETDIGDIFLKKALMPLFASVTPRTNRSTAGLESFLDEVHCGHQIMPDFLAFGKSEFESEISYRGEEVFKLKRSNGTVVSKIFIHRRFWDFGISKFAMRKLGDPAASINSDIDEFINEANNLLDILVSDSDDLSAESFGARMMYSEGKFIKDAYNSRNTFASISGRHEHSPINVDIFGMVMEYLLLVKVGGDIEKLKTHTRWRRLVDADIGIATRITETEFRDILYRFGETVSFIYGIRECGKIMVPAIREQEQHQSYSSMIHIMDFANEVIEHQRAKLTEEANETPLVMWYFYERDESDETKRHTANKREWLRVKVKQYCDDETNKFFNMTKEEYDAE